MTMHERWKRYQELRRQFPAEFEKGAPPGLCLEGDAPDRAGVPLGVLEEHDRWFWVREWDGQRSVERPVYRDGRLREEIEGYFRLTEERPELFVQSPLVPLCLDRHAMLEFVRQTGRRVGLVFDNGIYYQVLADLIAGAQPYVYARIVYPQRRSNGTVIVPVHTDGQGVRRFGVLQVFRHSLRALSGGEFPRGFLAPGLSPEENARKELGEEFGVRPEQIRAMTLLGETRSDTGLSAGQVQIYLAELEGEVPRGTLDHEGIAGSFWLREEELRARLASGQILDGLTQSAYLLYKLKENEWESPWKGNNMK